MKTIFHPAEERGHANHGWLDSHHSFSFANWYNPEKVRFGMLRVLNDDIVKVGGGFGMHPHENMEIVSIPLHGILSHKDSTGASGDILVGDVQIMSAGSGIQHSEYNGSQVESTHFLQIWVFPKKKNITPRYDQKTFAAADRKNQWQTLVSPDKNDNTLWINQDAVFARADLAANTNLNYVKRFQDSGVYFFVINGSVEINGQKLNARDAIGISETDSAEIKSFTAADVLAIEIPM